MFIYCLSHHFSILTKLSPFTLKGKSQAMQNFEMLRCIFEMHLHPSPENTSLAQETRQFH